MMKIHIENFSANLARTLRLSEDGSVFFGSRQITNCQSAVLSADGQFCLIIADNQHVGIVSDEREISLYQNITASRIFAPACRNRFAYQDFATSELRLFSKIWLGIDCDAALRERIEGLHLRGAVDVAVSNENREPLFVLDSSGQVRAISANSDFICAENITKIKFKHQRGDSALFELETKSGEILDLVCIGMQGQGFCKQNCKIKPADRKTALQGERHEFQFPPKSKFIFFDPDEFQANSFSKNTIHSLQKDEYTRCVLIEQNHTFCGNLKVFRQFCEPKNAAVIENKFGRVFETNLKSEMYFYSIFEYYINIRVKYLSLNRYSTLLVTENGQILHCRNNNVIFLENKIPSPPNALFHSKHNVYISKNQTVSIYAWDKNQSIDGERRITHLATQTYQSKVIQFFPVQTEGEDVIVVRELAGFSICQVGYDNKFTTILIPTPRGLQRCRAVIYQLDLGLFVRARDGSWFGVSKILNGADGQSASRLQWRASMHLTKYEKNWTIEGARLEFDKVEELGKKNILQICVDHARRIWLVCAAKAEAEAG